MPKKLWSPDLMTVQNFVERNQNSLFIPGLWKFSAATEEAEKQLFLEIKSLRSELSPDQDKVDVKRVLKCLLMTNPYDLRGARRLSSILEHYKVGPSLDESFREIMYISYLSELRGEKEAGTTVDRNTF